MRQRLARTRLKLAAAGSTLSSLIQSLPKEKLSWTGFKPSGSTGAWMLLLDGGYADAKSADKAKDFEALALTLAEEANVVAFLKNEPRWPNGFCSPRRSLESCRRKPAKSRQGSRNITHYVSPLRNLPSGLSTLGFYSPSISERECQPDVPPTDHARIARDKPASTAAHSCKAPPRWPRLQRPALCLDCNRASLGGPASGPDPLNRG